MAGQIARGTTRTIYVNDLMLDAFIGVHAHERTQSQRVRINLELVVEPPGDPTSDRIGDTVDYEWIVTGVTAMAATGHVNLVETLAENIADLCFSDARIATARVSVEKLDAFSNVGSVGIAIERDNPDAPVEPGGEDDADA